MAVKLYDYQQKAIQDLKNGSILCGGVGSGKSITAIAYYLFKVCDGDMKVIDGEINECLPFGHENFQPMKNPRDLYIITTAKKRDSLEWEKECANFAIYSKENPYDVKVTIDSWNNIKKYDKIYGAFFIFDEQRVVGNGAWVKAFLKIARKNQWILLTATPGDQWSDYIPVFVANGFYRNKSEFCNKHCVYSRFAKYPKIDRYVGLKELRQNRDKVLVHMKDQRETVRHNCFEVVDYDRELYHTVFVERWDPWENEPIAETGKLLYLTRKVVNSDTRRLKRVQEILDKKKRAIVFYNFSYELELLRDLCEKINIPYAEWNGKRHQDLPVGERWLYLVQYSAGCEGWNCVTANTIIFYSQNYSYRVTEQAAGRIDRINTPYKDLYYYYLISGSPIDKAIRQCLTRKKNFNESSFIGKKGLKDE